MIEMKYLLNLCSAATPQEKAWIVQRVEAMSVKEKIILNGAMKLKNPNNSYDLINALCQTDCFEVYYPVKNEFELGKFVAEKIEAVSQAAMKFVDYEILGEYFLNNQPGIFTDRGYVFMDMPIKQVYDGRNLETLADNFAVRLKLSSPKHKEGVWIKLPDYSEPNGYPGEVQMALDILEADALEECTLLEAQCLLPSIDNLSNQYNDLELLIKDSNNLGYVLDEQNQGMPNFWKHLLAALEYECCDRLDFALDISQNLYCYDFSSGEQCLEDYGRRLAQENGLVRPGSMIEAAFDYAAYGEVQAEKFGVKLTEYGMIGRNGKDFIFEFSTPNDEDTELRKDMRNMQCEQENNNFIQEGPDDGIKLDL